MTELDEMIRIALNAGKMIMHERHNFNVEMKGDRTPSTRTDRMVSKYILTELSSKFPSYGIIEEESSVYNAKKFRKCFVVDPLDGTVSYIRGDEYFGVLIGLMEDYKPVRGVSYLPHKNELCFAEKGTGAFLLNSFGLNVINVNSEKEITMLTSVYRANPDLNKIIQLVNPDNIRQMPTSFKTVEVAKGAANLFVCAKNTTMNLWDLCAPQAILEEAGGKITDIYGNPIDYEGDYINKNGVIASNGIIHGDVIKKINLDTAN